MSRDIKYIGMDVSKPVHIATENTDLSAELKRGRSFIRTGKSRKKSKKAALPRKPES